MMVLDENLRDHESFSGLSWGVWMSAPWWWVMVDRPSGPFVLSVYNNPTPEGCVNQEFQILHILASLRLFASLVRTRLSEIAFKLFIHY